MVLAPWRSPLAHALHRNRALAYARYVQLATVSPTGCPTNRTVVFRGFRPETNQLQFVTDQRSEKILHLRHQPWVEVCWYFPKSREQFRLAGPMQVLDASRSDPGAQTLRRSLWVSLSEAARAQFSGPTPGLPCPSLLRDAVSLDTRVPVPDSPLSPLDPSNPLPDFCALVLDPRVVDHLQLRVPQLRCRYSSNINDWSTEAINP